MAYEKKCSGGYLETTFWLLKENHGTFYLLSITRMGQGRGGGRNKPSITIRLKVKLVPKMAGLRDGKCLDRYLLTLLCR